MLILGIVGVLVLVLLSFLAGIGGLGALDENSPGLFLILTPLSYLLTALSSALVMFLFYTFG